jgi:hypothetical protein
MGDDRKGQSGSQSTGSTGSAWNPEEGYWREQHSNQPYADKKRSFEDYAAGYRLGVEGAEKYSGREYDEVEDSLATQWEQAQPGSAMPWDTIRPAVRAAWDRIAGISSARESDRGIRGSI